MLFWLPCALLRYLLYLWSKKTAKTSGYVANTRVFLLFRRQEAR
ncbi:hypothetical protein SeSB_A4209 [Salmonella enterica subsp. enterica serovar Schwarzengrund str. SL480]|uniref:Uncharacterized protein n=1 Tax=Salmonella schwarzengrund (strain CVM19633) TaxID=439843 RepID=A0A0N1QWP7_SALSV|nr:hypothetical protein SeSA_A4072 [Salmonella enterica subsp. enterica serovar Schwarzengrund str. CVM19633]EDY26965.1 hypothetical protein SeSB_A4209 [Salmonella enterica subsp. enterica serovar Schwarzengrund str. SL480]